MNRNPKDRHLKRLYAPHHWMLDKMSGVWAPRPRQGPHKIRECVPIIIILRNRLKYALTAKESKFIVSAGNIRVDGKVRKNQRFPCGLQDVVSINKTGEHFRLIYDVKGRFNLHRIPVSEANWKLCKIRKVGLAKSAVPYIGTHDGRTIPYPDPKIKVNDTIKWDFLKGKIVQVIPFEVGALVMITSGRNIGRVGVLEKVEKHDGSFDVVHIRDARDHEFATRLDNIFVIGSGGNSEITLPKTKGIKYSAVEDREMRLERQSNVVHNQNKRKELTGGETLTEREKTVRKLALEKRRLLKILREQENKQTDKKPKTGKKGKAKAKAKAEEPAEQ